MEELILIVEDDNDISQMLKELLTNQGFQTVQAYSGTEALLCMEKRIPKAVILDLMLPGMSGEEVLAKIKEQYPQVGVIVSSARDDVHTRVELLRAGADDYLVKPFDTEELVARLEAVLRRSQKEVESAAQAKETGCRAGGGFDKAGIFDSGTFNELSRKSIYEK